ncbi:MAG: tRNA (N(6)-L-threonylcarbamoyladenosine(37)-C(2))-methylthiotransferase MtaB [Candidatus Paracaedibacteraceae bacterium]|nr:tRNA (N(6)-L-threonylcarbamoyladenosine(37)-C(2))-methylthiotransferase MtaB [Candidatus Paracaedibacteraceae bacterium]
MSGKIVTFGCRLNTYESEVMRKFVDDASEEVIVFNTCAVTAEAERQARQAIRKARRENPNVKIIVTGCSAQVNPETYTNMHEVDRVLGNEDKLQAHNFKFDTLNTEKAIVNDIMSVKETAGHLISSFNGKSRAFIQIQNGCDHRCTFCIIPFGRGNSRSVPMGDIVRQTQQLVENGYQEIVLTGVDITAYGSDLPGQPKLGEMVRRLFALVPNIKRLRISSIDSVEVDDDLLKLVENESRLMPHFHLSLQAGDNLILKRMKRRHLREDAINMCKEFRRRRPDVVFGADLIAGFPTETEDMFQNTLRIVEECDLTYLHVFPYSQRPGTPAARMPQVVSEDIKDRAKRLRELGTQKERAFISQQVGKTASVLVESDSLGRTEHFAPVDLSGLPESSRIEGNIISLNITGVTNGNLTCERIIA